MDAFAVLSDEYENCIIEFWETQSADKIIFCIGNAKKIPVFERLSGILQNRIKENFSEKIGSWSSWQRVIDLMIDLAFSDDNFKNKFLHKITEMYEDFCKKINEMKKRRIGILKNNQSWINAKEIQLMLLNDREEDVLNLPNDTTSTFYKALVYLQKNEVTDLIKAEELYTEMLKENPDNYAASVNRFIADTRICIASKKEKRNKYYQLAKIRLSEIREHFPLDINNGALMYANALYFYDEMEDAEEFWKICNEMPRKFWNDITCARYIIYTYIRSGEFEKAEELLNSLARFYGRTEEIRRLEEQIEEKHVQEKKLPIGNQPEVSEIPVIIHALEHIRSLSELDTARVYFRGREMDELVESHLLKLMLETTSVLSQYCDYLRFNGEAAPENYYNKFMMILFNRNQQEIYDYYMRDQSQEGTASDILSNGRQSAGSTDLFINHAGNSISIVEGIRISRMCRKNMKEHIEKLFGYNYVEADTMFVLLYADVNDISQTWKKYIAFLGELQRKRELTWPIERIVQRGEIKLIRKQMRKDKYVCMTEHYYEKDDEKNCIHIYHIMVDIKKSAQKQAAIRARNK